MKVMAAVILAILLSVGFAQSFSVGATYTDGLRVEAEYRHETGMVFGVATAVGTWNTDVFAGVSYTLLAVEELELNTRFLLYLPVFVDGYVVLGQLSGSVGLEANIVQDNGAALIAGVFLVDSNWTDKVWPGIGFRLALGF